MLTSPKAYARTCGLLYLAVSVAGVFAELYVRGTLIVHGDAAATAQKIAASELLWRSGVVANLFGTAGYIAVTLMLYVLLKPVDKNLSLLAAFFSIVGCATGAVNALADYAALSFLGEPGSLKILLGFHLPGYSLSLVFFGVYCTLLGYLIFRSGYFPKAIGVLLLVGGPCYVINSSLIFLAPAMWARMPVDIVFVSGIAELALTFWLLVMGIDVAKWNERVCGVLPSSAAV